MWLDHRHGPIVEGDGPRASVAARRAAEARLLASPAIATRIIDRLGLADLPGIGQPNGAVSLPPDQAQRRAIAYLLDGVRVEATGASYAVAVRFAARDAQVAAGIVNQFVDQYVDLRREDPDRARAIERLREQAEIARTEMTRARAAADSYSAGAGSAGQDQAAGQIRSEPAGSGPPDVPTSTGETDSQATLRDLRARLAVLNGERSALLERYGPLHPDVVAVDARVADVNRAIADETKRAAAQAVRARAAAQLAREEAGARLAASDKAAAERVRLEASASAAADRYRSLADAVRRAEAARPASSGAYVIARASVPQAPDSPNPWTFAAAGLVAALLVSGGVVGVGELLTPGFRTPHGAERKLGLPVVGSVPDVAEVADAQGSAVEPINLALTHRGSSLAAAFDGIRSGLGLGRGGTAPRSVAVSSAVAGEGKTTVSIGLVRSAALAGLRVLLIDCDVRRPAASRLLAPDAEFGLADVVSGRVTLERALVRDAPSGAALLASRPGGPAGDGLVGSDAMMELLTDLAPDYDLVVLDTAPVLALVETRIVAGFADRVLLVARWRWTPTRATRIARDILDDTGVKVLALALTRVDA